jgi:hypothetical protein
MTAIDLIQRYPSIRAYYGSDGQLCCNIYGKRHSIVMLAKNIHMPLSETKSLLRNLVSIQHSNVKINMEF